MASYERIDPDHAAVAEITARLVTGRIIEALYENRPPVPPGWLNFDQAAAYLGYTTTKAFRDRCSQPNPPRSVKHGRLRKFRREWLDEWMMSGDE
ncbi:MAG TPA: hypothetical protein PKK10_09280 [Woeseiaceae bacterium]|nr:hypothetical protein [Woeseiaceae bacterium]